MEYPFKDLMPLDEVLAREGYYKDWTHLDPEVFYSLTQISNFIKTKGYGVDVRLLIAQLAEHFGLKTTQVVDLGNLIQAEHDALKQQVQQAVAQVNADRNALETQFNQSVAQMEADKNTIIANATVDSEVILARGGKPTLQARLDETTAQLAHTMRVINVKEYGAKGDALYGVVGGGYFKDSARTEPATDDTQAILDAVNAANSGDTIYFPSGYYAVTGLVINKDVNIRGASMKSSRIRNYGVGKDALVIKPDQHMVEELRIDDITVEGNANGNFGEGATTGSGIVLDNVWIVYMNNVKCWFNGGHGLHLKGNNWTIFITMCRFERNKLDGVRALGQVQQAQINAIRFSNCRAGANGKNGFNVWGTSFTIRDNTIEGNKSAGVRVSSDEVVNTNACTNVSILDNYFEMNLDGNLYIKGNAITSNVIQGLTIDNNYGFHQNVTGGHSPGVDFSPHAVTFEGSSPFHPDQRDIRDVYYGVNHFVQQRTDSVAVNFNKILGPDSIVKLRWTWEVIQPQIGFSNLGKAKTIGGLVRKHINGYMHAKGDVSYPHPKDMSDNIPSGTNPVIYFPLNVKAGDYLNEAVLKVETDCTDYTLIFQILRLNGDGTETNMGNLSGLANLNGSVLLKMKNINVTFEEDYDYLLRLRRIDATAAVMTYFRIGHPYIVIGN